MHCRIILVTGKPVHGLLTIDELVEWLTVHHDDDGWKTFTRPKLQAIGARIGTLPRPSGSAQRAAG